MNRKSLTLALALALLAPALASAEAVVYKVDPDHSAVSFSIRHFVSNVPGRFKEFERDDQVRQAEPGGVQRRVHRPRGVHRHRQRRPRQPPARRRLFRRPEVPEPHLHQHRGEGQGRRHPGRHGRPDHARGDQAGHHSSGCPGDVQDPERREGRLRDELYGQPQGLRGGLEPRARCRSRAGRRRQGQHLDRVRTSKPRLPPSRARFLRPGNGRRPRRPFLFTPDVGYDRGSTRS